MEGPLVSVCCVAYNHAPYIRQALDGVLMQQTDFPFEILVHDDASTDGTTDVIREYAAQYPNQIRPLYETENQYSKDNRVFKNFIYPHAKGEYFALLECDDFWCDPRKLQKQVAYMEAHPDCSGTFHAANWLRGDRIIKNDRHFSQEFDATPAQVITGGGAFCHTSSLCFRREYAFDLPLFRQMDPIGDFSFEILLALRGKFHGFPEIMSCWRFSRPGSWTEKTAKSMENQIRFNQKEIAELQELDRYTNYLYSTEIYYQISKDRCDLFSWGQIPFSEVKESFSHMRMGHMKLSRMRRCYDRLLRKHCRWMKQKT